MGTIDIILAFPNLVLAIAVAGILGPGLAIMFTVPAFNMLGDGLRDVLGTRI